MDFADHPVFISHATPDRAPAYRICDALESRGIRCWITPRDLETGSRFGDAIARQIPRSSAVVLVLSEATASARWVPGEIHNAFEQDVPVFPVRIEDALPKDSLQLIVSTSQWLDLFAGDFDELMDRLAADLRKRARRFEGEAGSDVGSDATEAPGERRGAYVPTGGPSDGSGAARWVRRYGAFVAAAVAVAVFAVFNLTGALRSEPERDGSGSDSALVAVPDSTPELVRSTDSAPGPDVREQGDGAGSVPPPGKDELESEVAATGRSAEGGSEAPPEAVRPATGVLVAVYGAPGSGAGSVESILLSELAERGIPSMDRVSLDPASATSPVPVDAEQLAALRAGSGVAFVVVGDLRVEAVPSIGSMYTGRATLSVRTYDTGTRRLVGTQTFQVGGGGKGGEIGGSPMAATDGAATKVAHQAVSRLARDLTRRD